MGRSSSRERRRSRDRSRSPDRSSDKIKWEACLCDILKNANCPNRLEVSLKENECSDDTKFVRWMLGQLNNKTEEGKLDEKLFATIFAALPYEVRNDSSVVWCAMDVNPETFKHAGEDRKKDKDVAFVAVQHEVENIEFVHRDLFYDTAFLLRLVELARYHPQFILDYVPDLCIDKDFALPAVEDNAEVFEQLPQWLRADHDVVAVAISNDVSTFEYACETLHGDADFVKRMLKMLGENGKDLVEYIDLEQDESNEVREVIAAFVEEQQGEQEEQEELCEN
jgi:hypothetical protein